MAIVRKTNKTASTARTNDSWKALAFLNIYVSKRDGSRARLGNIPLRSSNAAENSILTWIGGDSSKTAKLLEKFHLEYHAVNAEVSDEFDFIEGIDTAETTESDVLGFLNLSLPTASGLIRFASIALRAGNRNVETIAAWLEQDAEANVEVLRTRLSIDFQDANPNKVVEFLLD